MKTFKDVNEYISSHPKEIQKILKQFRATIKKAAPLAEEAISYGMPSYKYNGVLAYFGAFKNHIGFYAMPTGHAHFKKELSVYKVGKGSVQFPIDKPMPIALITKMIKFRLKENMEKAKAKKTTK
jgi:uncharacterized protein YdhG (YjbR/CyaY superfamily)